MLLYIYEIMKKIEEQYLKSEHKVKAYDVYLSAFRPREARRVLACCRLYDGDKFICDNFTISEFQSDKIEIMFEMLNRILAENEQIDLFTIRVSNKTFGKLLQNAAFEDESSRYFSYVSKYKELLGKREAIIVIPNWCTATKKDYEVEDLAKKLYFKIPSRKTFLDFCIKKNWIEEGFSKDLWKLLFEIGWKNKDGNYCEDWRTLAGTYNSVLRTGENAKYGKVKPKSKDIVVEKKRLAPNYICYTDGSCDNYSTHKAGGSAYIVVNTSTGELEKVKTHHCLHTTSNRMEMLAIISAVNYCPKGSVIEVRSDSKYALKMFRYTDWEIGVDIKNPDLIKLYRKCAKDKLVILTWVKGHNGDDLNEQADCLAFSAYEKALKENGLPMAPEKYRAMRRGKQTVFETDN